MKPVLPRDCGAFTLMEALVMLAVLAVLLAVVLPALSPARRRSGRTSCINNLQQVGAAFQIWAGDHNGRYPMDIPVREGGARELIAAGNVAACFRAISNELAAPKFLVCPQDSRRQVAANFNCLNRLNLSYFIGFDATNSATPAALAGDDNLMLNGCRVASGVLNLGPNTFSWTPERHDGFGNVLQPDGTVQTVRQLGSISNAETVFISNLW